MEIRYTVELMGSSKYYDWDFINGFTLFNIEPTQLYMNADLDEDYLLAVF